MYKSILVLIFSDECATIDAQSWTLHQKIFRYINVSPSRNKMVDLAQNLLFLSAGIFQMNIFLVAFHDFRQETGFLPLLIVVKGQGLFFTSKNGRGAFEISKKRGRVRLRRPSKNVKYEHLNFVKSPFSPY